VLIFAERDNFSLIHKTLNGFEKAIAKGISFLGFLYAEAPL